MQAILAVTGTEVAERMQPMEERDMKEIAYSVSELLYLAISIVGRHEKVNFTRLQRASCPNSRTKLIILAYSLSLQIGEDTSQQITLTYDGCKEIKNRILSSLIGA